MDEESTAQSDPPRRFSRLRQGQMVAGVATGIGRYLDVDPWLVRAAFVILSFFGGAGLVAYLILLVVMPQDGAPAGSSPMEHMYRSNWRGPLPFGLLIPVLLIVFFNGFNFRFHRFFFIPLALIVVGFLFFKDRWHPAMSGSTVWPSNSWRRQDADDTAASSQNPAQTTTQNFTAPNFASGSTVTTPAYGGGFSAPRYYNRRSPLRMITVGLATLAFGVAIWLNQVGVFHPRIQQILAFPMIVLGMGLLVGTFYGRTRTLIVPALMLLPLTIAATMADVPFYSSTGVHLYRPLTAQDVQTSYSLGAGRTVLDLSKVDVNQLPDNIDVEQGAGEMVIVIPRNESFTVHAFEGAGVIDVMGHRSTGFSPQLTTATPGAATRVHMTLHTGFGRTFVTDDSNSQEAR